MSAHNAERRLLLSEDDERQIWLDLETGEQIEVAVDPDAILAEESGEAAGEEAASAPGPLIALAREVFEEFGVDYETPEPHVLAATLHHRTVISRFNVIVDEAERTVNVLAHLPLIVPAARHAAISEAAMRLMCLRTRATILLNHERGEMRLAHNLALSNLEPTREWLVHHVLNLYYAADVIFPALVGVASGMAEAVDAVALVDRAREQLKGREE